MEITLNFELAQPGIPSDYRRIFISFIKKALSEVQDGRYLEKFYHDTQTKNFCFNVLMPKPVFQKEQIVLQANRIRMQVRASDRDNTGLILMGAFINQKHKRFPLPVGNSMVLAALGQKPSEQIKGEKLLLRTAAGSGIVVRDHDRETNRDTYHTVEEADFNDQLEDCLKRQVLELGFPPEKAEAIRCRMVKGEKLVVRHYGQMIDISKGFLQLAGPLDVLQMLYDVGLGSRHSSGYGVCTLVSDQLF